jgi:GDP-L-fucose synthase
VTSYWTGKRVMVSGGSGFLGTHVTEKLRQTDCAEVVVVRSRDHDLTNEDQVGRLFAAHHADVVFHLAGYVGGIGANQLYPADFFYRNIMMGVLTMHYAWRSGAAKFIAAGAGCGYPEHASLPLKEEQFWDGFPQAESAAYSLAKRMLHVQAAAYWRQHRFPAVVTIPGNIYGPYDNFDLDSAHVVPALVRKFVSAVAEGHREVVVWGTGAPLRDFVYAGDVAEGMLRAAEVYDRAELVNLSSGTATSIREVVEMLRRITGFTGTVVWDGSRPDGQAERRFDVGKAGRDLNWSARTPLREGLQATVDWYRANRDRARN